MLRSIEQILRCLPALLSKVSAGALKVEERLTISGGRLMVTTFRPPTVAAPGSSLSLDPGAAAVNPAEPMLWLVALFLRWLVAMLGGIAVLAALGLLLYRRCTR
jgi:hypothetical protein